MVLRRLLQPHTIEISSGYLDKWSAIERLADLIVSSGKATDRDTLLSASLDRERRGSTGFGHGIAIPRARTEIVREVGAALGISAPGMDFDSTDGRPCHLVFLIVAPPHEPTQYLEALAAAAALRQRPSLIARLKEAGCVDDVLASLNASREGRN